MPTHTLTHPLYHLHHLSPGKTLVAVLPVYLNALSGDGAFVVTTSDYLSRRDGETMGQVQTHTQSLTLTSCYNQFSRTPSTCFMKQHTAQSSISFTSHSYHHPVKPKVTPAYTPPISDILYCACACTFVCVCRCFVF